MIRSIFKWFRRLSFGIGFLFNLLIWTIIALAAMWSISSWYNYQQGDKQLVWGASWSVKQAERLGLDPETDLDRFLSEVPIERLQLMSYWDQIEPQDDNYDFTSLDELLIIAKSRNVKVSLQIGLHQPRWPRCHIPDWAGNLDDDEFSTQLKEYITQVINRFDGEIHVIQYQLESAIFQVDKELCSHYLDKEDLIDLYQFVKELTEKEIAVSRPNNSFIWRKQNPSPDSFGLKLEPYLDKHSWLEKYFQQSLPSGYYSFTAGNLKIFHSESDIFISDLGVEPAGLDDHPVDLKLDPQMTSSGLEQISDLLNYAHKTNIRTIDLRGAEWWFLQKENGDDRFLKAVSQTIQDI